MNSRIRKYPIFILLLPIFFVLHGYLDNYVFVTPITAAFLAFKYLVTALVLFLLFWLLYKNNIKASLAALLILTYNFFFGSVHDFLKSLAPNSFIIKYSIILPVSIVLILLVILYLKKTNKSFLKITEYLNYLFLLLIVIDSVNFVVKSFKKNTANIKHQNLELSSCDTCTKSDIYLIVADEYANTEELKEIFNFDNSAFDSSLKQRDFHIVKNAKSNYNSTPFSIASMLDMNFIDSLGDNFNDKSLKSTYSLINENTMTFWLQKQGYQVVNHSGFPLANIPNPISSTFFITGADLITSHTFEGRFNRDLRWNFITRFKIKSEIKKFVQTKINYNQKLIDKTVQIATQKNKNSKFVYLHLMMPHFPYLYDSAGKPDYETSFSDTNRLDKGKYIGYLQYSNQIFLKLIDKIQSASPDAIIIFMGDHGFRHMEGNEKAHFMSFNSIYLPTKKYNQFYDGMSMVNEFRVLLNTQFDQKLPLVKDSTIFLRNWW